MQLFKDYYIKGLGYITFRPLPLFMREEFSIRWNSLDKTKSLKWIIFNDEYGCFNIKKCLALYNLNLDELDLDDIEGLCLDCLIPLNFPKALKSKEETQLDKSDKIVKPLGYDYISLMISRVWGITTSFIEALKLLETCPADMLIETLECRSKQLEEVYKTPDDKKKERKEKMVNLLKKKAKRSSEDLEKKLEKAESIDQAKKIAQREGYKPL